jgi:peptidoglycan/xylan/chitin deacetylase (PgdA/CDA1 family)
MTVFHLIKAVGVLEVDNYSLTPLVASDTTAPLVSLTSPTASSTVSGVVNITASSTDNVAVSGVRFLVDGVQVGAEDTTSPYSVSWNTASTTNGNKILSAVSRDSSGNVATSTSVVVSVSNSIPDTTLPFIEIENVLNNATLSGDFHIHINATDNVQISNIQLKLNDIVLVNLPEDTHYHFDLDTTLYTNGNYTLTAIATDTSLNTSSTTVNISINNVVLDTNPPVTTITNPTNNSNVSGNLNIGVTATDDVAVSAVHILVDGISVVVDNTFPYEATIDTNTYSNGQHSITAYSVDTSDNIGNASPVLININNAPIIPPATNLIANASVETVDSVDPTKPENWFKGGWGTNTTSYTYPSNGNHLNRGAKIDISSYTDGDAKWFFNDVPVVAGETYTFKSEYKSNVPTVLTARFGYPDNSVQYRDIANLASTTVWTNTSNDILIPPGANKVTVFHIINSAGTLEVDNYFLGATIPTGNTFASGIVSLTFDDGWVSHYTEALPILNSSPLKAGFYIITQESINAVSDNRVNNPNLEITNIGSTTTPQNWNTETTGVNNSIFTYPVAGQSGAGARVEITSYTSGNAKWTFNDATAISNQEYKISFYYRSDVNVPVVGRFTLNDDSTFTLPIGIATTSTNWVKFERNLYMPINLRSLTFYANLDQVGYIEVDNFDLNRVPVFLNPTQIQQMKSAGHEIGSHTQTHPYLTTLSGQNLINEVNGSKTDLSNTMGITGINTFVYPYGDYDQNVKQAVINAGYYGGRSVDRGLNYRDTDKFALKVQQVDRTTNLAQFQSWLDDARNNNAWLILMFHQVDNNPNATLGVSPALFQQMVDALVAQQVTVVTMEQGLGLMNP